MTKILALGAAALAISATPLLAQDFGGNVSAAYGLYLVHDDVDSSAEETMQETRLSGSFGYNTGNFGAQLDLGSSSTADFEGDDNHKFTGGIVHLYYDLSGYNVGAFYGMANTDHDDAGYAADVTWYGFEMSRDMGNMSFAAQIGTVDNDSDHDSLDSSGELYLAAEGSYDFNNDLTFSAGISTAGGEIHGDPLRFNNYFVEADYDIGNTNLSAFARYDLYSAKSDGEVDGGLLTENSIMLGIRYEFGNQAATPMMESMLPAYASNAAATYD